MNISHIKRIFTNEFDKWKIGTRNSSNHSKGILLTCLQFKLFIIPADKVANNYTFVGENFYIQSLCSELGIENVGITDNDIHEYVANKNALDIINAHRKIFH